MEVFGKVMKEVVNAERKYPIGCGVVKRKIVIEAMGTVVDTMLVPRWVPVPLRGVLSRWIAGIIVDCIVYVMNTILGKRWLLRWETGGKTNSK